MTHERKDGKTEEKDEARTPTWLFEYLKERWHFTADLATTTQGRDDKTMAVRTNALCKKWIAKSANCPEGFLDPDVHLNTDDVGWCNPPYSLGNIDRFIQKCYLESLDGPVIGMLLPMDSSTAAFHRFCMKAQKWILFRPRIQFWRPDGAPMSGSPKFGSFFCVFDEKGRRSQSGPLVESVDVRPLKRAWQEKTKVRVVV